MNWYTKAKLAAYDVATTYGFWLDMTGELLYVEPQKHTQTIQRSGWLSPGWEEEYEDTVEAAFNHGIIRVVVSPSYSISPYDDPDAKLLSFENLYMEKITPQQRQVMIGMFKELKRSNRNSLCSLEFRGVPYTTYKTVYDLEQALNPITVEIEDPSVVVNI